jgi:CheY-like chemotaxis protein
VKDTGCGIEKESRQHIFEPFYTTTELGKGTGLGLPAVFGAMKEHNGRIKLISEVGVGTEFTLFFPVKQTDQFAEKRVPEPIQRGSANILVIDDEDLLLSVADGLLTELGYNVMLAKGGKAGIEKYQKNSTKIDLVLLDMIMPEMDGASCFVALKEINPEIKVIICSGFAKTPKVKEVVKLGACCFLQKPYTASEVSNAVIQALRS